MFPLGCWRKWLGYGHHGREERKRNERGGGDCLAPEEIEVTATKVRFRLGF